MLRGIFHAILLHLLLIGLTFAFLHTLCILVTAGQGKIPAFVCPTSTNERTS